MRTGWPPWEITKKPPVPAKSFKSPVSRAVTARRDDPSRVGIQNGLPANGLTEAAKSMLSKIRVMTPLGEATLQEDIYRTGGQEMVIKVDTDAELMREQLKLIRFIPVINKSNRVIRVYSYDKGGIRLEGNKLILRIMGNTDYTKLTDEGRAIADETVEILKALSSAVK